MSAAAPTRGAYGYTCTCGQPLGLRATLPHGMLYRCAGGAVQHVWYMHRSGFWKLTAKVIRDPADPDRPDPVLAESDRLVEWHEQERVIWDT